MSDSRDPRPAPERIHHLAVAAEWDAAVARGGPYERSTIDASLAEEGFIHCSLAEQVRGTADRYYQGRRDILLLTIDTAKVGAPVVVEDLLGRGTAFPHIYGPLPLDAVISATPVPLGADGRLDLDAVLPPNDEPPGR